MNSFKKLKSINNLSYAQITFHLIKNISCILFRQLGPCHVLNEIFISTWLFIYDVPPITILEPFT